jgi:hypothetical protein
MAVAATGSVGETIAPKTNAAAQGRPTSRCATEATVRVVSSTRPMDRDAIGLRFALRSRGEEKKAAEYRSGGRKIKRTRSGGSLISGTTGIRPNASPPRTRTG